MSDEDRAREDEDRIFNRSVGTLQLVERLRLALSRLTPNQMRKRPIGRPTGPVVTLAELEATVDRLARDRVKPSQSRLADAVPYSRSALSRWFQRHPEAWPALRARWRDRL